MTKVGIVGSRRRQDYWNIWELVDTFSKDTIVVSGGCKGPDKWATDHAKLKGLKIVAQKLQISTDKGKGYRILSNISEDGGQEVPHLHFHLFGGEKISKMVS